MAKYYGSVGYVETVETVPGVWEEVATERKYSGDILRNKKTFQGGENLNDNLNVNNQFSIVADPYAINHFFAIRYIEWQGVLWKVTDVDVEFPRLLLSIGGVYNGLKA